MKSKACDKGALQDWRAEGACKAGMFFWKSISADLKLSRRNAARMSLNFVAAQTLMHKQNLNDIP
jgi:hypothetical protein